ncbi:aminoglycoside phosphotransferase family protein [Roseibium suaedae]|uniref:Predicted kinase, aminoglycoside phosphotransferase (APT) family n=1 Tax=Roseibium suaedae TaxID=735517 RepID=A0A1M7BLX8_9HYPH|nr:aminoglycoside phosphotransferase family protein [Roseibium suaedae]SHL56045.1 Predicted kinase, aminoglycoside phosphotransferase (APT) family [Roseibium suaedae]
MDEFGVSIVQARDLLVSYATDWAQLPIQDVASSGTDNALFRLGEDAVLRLPKRRSAVIPLEKEIGWLPRLQGLPLSVPVLLFHGSSKQDTGYDFGIFRWEPGRIAVPGEIAQPDQAAICLARFLRQLHLVDPQGAPEAGPGNHQRGVPLPLLTEAVLSSIDVLEDEIDVLAARKIWDKACAAVPVQRPVWIHGDLKADNMLAQDGRLTAVIDWGLAAVGDPAVDYAAAWTWIAPESRDLFRSECGLSEDDWSRARGWALYGAVIALSYYRGRSHEELCQQCRQTLKRLDLALT